MDLILRTRFLEISHSIDFLTPTKKKGEALVAACHVRLVQEIRKNGKTFIDSYVIRQTSVTSPPYNVQVEIDDNRHITSVHCTCVAEALGRCKHVYALIYFINSDRSTSKTSEEQQWGKPSISQLGKSAYSKPLKVCDGFSRKDMKPSPKFKIKPEHFDENHDCSFRLVVVDMHKSEDERLKKRQELLLFEERVAKIEKDCLKACLEILMITSKENYIYEKGTPDKLHGKIESFFQENIYLNDEQINKLCLDTKNQSGSSKWFEEKRLRISASSKAHSIKIRKKRTMQSLAVQFLTSQITPNKNMKYGLRKEKVAVEEYKQMYDVCVFHIGLFVAPQQPWLCASVDGLVIEDDHITKLLEIKCPITCQKIPVYDHKSGSLNVKYLEITNGNIELVRSEQYYSQCQLQMYVTGINVCDLHVWSPCGSCTVEVHRDEEFLAEVIPLLNKFYFSCYLKTICNKNES